MPAIDAAMTSLARWIGLGVLLVAAHAVTASAATHSHMRGVISTVRASSPHAPPAPSYLRDQITQLGQAFDGQVGIAVRSIDDGWLTGWKSNSLFPQQSVSKLWVSITALDAVDRGKISLGQQITLTRDDLTLFHQPIAEQVLAGPYTTTIGDLMVRAITSSDNTANDKLMRCVGGAGAVRAMIRSKHLGAIRFYNGERALQSRIAGLIWNPSYSIGNAFFDARDALPAAARKAAFDRYVANPFDGRSEE